MEVPPITERMATKCRRDVTLIRAILLGALAAIPVLVGLALAAASPAFTQDAPDPADRQVYFGEQHLHTAQSADAFAFGTRNNPDEAYRYCKGEPIRRITRNDL